MHLQQIHLKNFRNYLDLSIDFSDFSRVALVGENAQGKSNFLEAIFVLAFVSSYRTQKLVEVIQWQQDLATIHADFIQEPGFHFEVQLQINHQGKKYIRLNHEYQQKLHDYIGKVKLVFFSSRDLQLILGGPSERRRFLDMVLTQIYPRYYQVLKEYLRILKHRNALLKQFRDYHDRDRQLLDQLDSWDLQLSRQGSYLMMRRMEGVACLQKIAERVHSQISNRMEPLLMVYQSAVGDAVGQEQVAEAFLERLLMGRKKDIQRTQTSIGPHRDDILFFLEKREMKLFASQGQMRTLALALKIAEVFFLAENMDDTPLLLLDDVFSELDRHRQGHLLDLIESINVQTFLTTTHLENGVSQFLRNEGCIFSVQNGHLKKSHL